jgi:hypothetical protein
LEVGGGEVGVAEVGGAYVHDEMILINKIRVIQELQYDSFSFRIKPAQQSEGTSSRNRPNLVLGHRCLQVTIKYEFRHIVYVPLQ